MTEPAPRNRSFYWTTRFFRELVRNGVKHVVISPGSRSTPLTLAAAAHPGLNKHVVLDERSAAFTALGMAKATGTPAVLICTSGTAPANYYPAVIESRLSGVPLILATADRPPNLRSTGANQAIDQLKMFGDYPVFHHEVGEPRFKAEDLNRLFMLARQAVHFSTAKKGSVHLNFPFRKPLEPEPKYLAKTERENKRLSKSHIEPSITHNAAIELKSGIRRLIENSSKPLIIAGPLAGITAARYINELAETIEAPILAEGGFCSWNSIEGYEGFLRQEKSQSRLKPDLILRFGFQPTGKAIEQTLNSWRDVPHIHFPSSDDWQDATFSVTHMVNWQEQPVNWNVKPQPCNDWIEEWRLFEQAFKSNVQTHLSGQSKLTDLHVYYYLTSQIVDPWNVFLSNSFAARDALLAGRFQTPYVYVNRGASGIDGITSTAMGVNLAMNQPTVLFTGDLAFLHDTNALLSQHLLEQPLIIIVVNNNGGNIFRMLPIIEHASYYRDYFETPQNANIAAMAETYEVGHTKITDVQSLNDLNLVDVAKNTGRGIHIVECCTDSEASMTIRENLWSGDHEA